MSQVSRNLSQSTTVTAVTALKHRVTLTGYGQVRHVRDTCPSQRSATKCDRNATPVAAIYVRQTATVCDTLLRCFPNRLDSVDPLATYSNNRSSKINLALSFKGIKEWLLRNPSKNFDFPATAGPHGPGILRRAPFDRLRANDEPVVPGEGLRPPAISCRVRRRPWMVKLAANTNRG